MVDYHAVLTVVSQIIGWIYFFAWSLSFYPQVWDNFYRKSVVGLSFDFLALNILGHSSYLVYNVVLFWDKGAQDLYRKEHPDATSIPVELNDVIFSIHAVTLTIITIVQCFIYERAKQTVSWLARILIGLALLAIAVVNILALCKVVSWLFVLNFLGFVKMGCSFVKYCPQVYMNYKRKMTVGWSIGNILLDFTGGVLSILQMVLNAVNKGNWSEFYNFTKVGLGLLSIVFDLIFVLQHYVIYRKSNQEYWRKFREEKQKGTHYYESEEAEREKLAINIDNNEVAPGQEKEDSPLVAKDFQQREQSQEYEPHYPHVSPSSPVKYQQS